MATDSSVSSPGPLDAMTNEVVLPDSYFEALSSNLRRRDRMAQKLGGLEFEYEQAKVRYLSDITQSLREEAQLMNAFLEQQGVKDLGEWVWVQGERRLVRRSHPNQLV